jgi:hypothetical protein
MSPYLGPVQHQFQEILYENCKKTPNFGTGVQSCELVT